MNAEEGGKTPKPKAKKKAAGEGKKEKAKAGGADGTPAPKRLKAEPKGPRGASSMGWPGRGGTYVMESTARGRRGLSGCLRAAGPPFRCAAGAPPADGRPPHSCAAEEEAAPQEAFSMKGQMTRERESSLL